MSLISGYLSKTITKLTKEQLAGASRIISNCFYNFTKLEYIGIPSSVKSIGINCFYGCLALTEIDSSSMDPFCLFVGTDLIYNSFINNNGWFNSFPAGSMVTLANGQILVGNKISTPSNGLVIPSTVKNIAPNACQRYGDTTDSNFTSVVIPDTVEMLQGYIFSNQTSLTKITVGAGVRKMTGRIVPGTSVKNMIFRQPAGMTVELPTPGKDTGIAYNKDAYSMNIYTDNEDIRNYGWATDNVTPTFYPLSSAP